MASVKFSPAPEIKVIADELIPKYHQHLIDFSVKIEYVFVDKTPKSKSGKWGSCKKISGQNAFLANQQEGSDPFFVITIPEPIWEALSHDSKLALVDHYLCFAHAEANQKDDDGESDPVKLSLETPDLVEFSCIVRRHGLWRDEVKVLVDAFGNKSTE
jgi:hypothetical protein